MSKEKNITPVDGTTTGVNEDTAVKTDASEKDAEIKRLMEQLENEKKAREKAEQEAFEAGNAAMKFRAELEQNRTKAQTTQTNDVIQDASEERVKIKLFKDNKEYKDDVVVGLNGKIYQIKRGIEVEVPKGVAEILANSQAQEERTAEMIEMLVAETEAKEKELNN